MFTFEINQFFLFSHNLWQQLTHIIFEAHNVFLFHLCGQKSMTEQMFYSPSYYSPPKSASDLIAIMTIIVR